VADSKVSQLPALTSLASPDLFMVVDDPNGTPTSKRVTVKTIFGAVPANTVFSANVDMTGNRAKFSSNVVVTKTMTVNNVIATLKTTPASNNATTESLSVGQMFFTNTHLYIAVNATTIRRVALSVF
jgi:hypothetical protein